MTAAAPRRRVLVRVLAAAWLAFAAVVVLGLAGELWLRLERRAAVAASERFRATNVFFANGMELNAGNHSLWQERWQEYLPGAKLDVVIGGERFVVEMSSEGYRTHEFEVPKPEGMVRIICIGGSTTVAGRTNDETYPALLERKLRELFPGLPLEVLNLGVSSATTDYWHARLPRVFGYEPDVIVQYPGVNDISWRALPHFANAHPGRGRYYQSLLVQRLVPVPRRRARPLPRGDVHDARRHGSRLPRAGRRVPGGLVRLGPTRRRRAGSSASTWTTTPSSGSGASRCTPTRAGPGWCSATTSCSSASSTATTCRTH